MKTLILFAIATFLCVSAAPSKTARDTLQPFELAMLDKLHQPWAKVDKRPEYPRKGEYMCKGAVCKMKVEGCEDCQYAIPLE